MVPLRALRFSRPDRSAETPSKTGTFSPLESNTAKSNTPVTGMLGGIQNDADLAEILAAWPNLPKALRAEIAAMVKSAREGSRL